MKSYRRSAPTTLLCCLASAVAIAAGSVGSAYAWAPPENWEAGTCTNKACTYESVEKNHAEAFNRAAAHPPWGITSFEVPHPGGKPEETLKRIRVDVPPGLAADPQTLPACKRAEFDSGLCNPLTKAGIVQL